MTGEDRRDIYYTGNIEMGDPIERKLRQQETAKAKPKKSWWRRFLEYIEPQAVPKIRPKKKARR